MRLLILGIAVLAASQAQAGDGSWSVSRLERVPTKRRKALLDKGFQVHAHVGIIQRILSEGELELSN